MDLSTLSKTDLITHCKKLSLSSGGKNKKELMQLIQISSKSNAHQTFVKPFVKWVGGKTQIIEQLAGIFPRRINTYYEPFLGGGSVLLAFLSMMRAGLIDCNEVCAGDSNVALIGVYKCIQSAPDALIDWLQKLTNTYARITGNEIDRKPTIATACGSKESFYYYQRARFNELCTSLTETADSAVEQSALFIFLNKTCFRGLYRAGPNGFNVPFGNYDSPAVFSRAHIREVSACIQEVIFAVESFETVVARADADDFIYLDPPYAPVPSDAKGSEYARRESKSFVGYTADGFDLSAHMRLFEACAGMTEREVRICMSNADVPLVNEAFKASEYAIKHIMCKRAINSKSPGLSAGEVIITNFLWK